MSESNLIGNFWNTVKNSRQGIQDVTVSMIPQGVGVMTGFITSVFIARGLGPTGLGRLTLALSLSVFATVLSDFGINQTAIRYAASAYAKGDVEGQMAVLRWAFRLRIFIMFIVMAFLFLISPLLAEKVWRDNTLSPLLRLGLLGSVFAAFASIPMIYFQSVKMFGVNSAISTAQKLAVFFGIIVIYLMSKWSVYWVLAATLVASGISSFFLLALTPKRALFPSFKTIKIKFIKINSFWESPIMNGNAGNEYQAESPMVFTTYLLISTILTAIILQMDVWLIGFYLENKEVGIYNAAGRFTLPLGILIGGLNTALWPRASSCRTYEQTIGLLKRTIRWCGVLSIGGVFYSIGAPLLMPYLFGESYATGIILAQLLSVRYCFNILSLPVITVAYNLGIVRELWKINLLQLTAVVLINVVLLPRIGSKASAFALLANDLISLVIVTLFVRNKTHSIKRNSNAQ